MKNIPIRSILPPQAGELDSFRIFHINDILAGEDMNQALHRHDFYFILLISKGLGFHEIDFTAHPITDNSISIMRPGQIHQFELKAGSEGYWVAFNKECNLLSPTANSLLRNVASQNFLTLNEKRIEALCSILQKVREEYIHKQRRFDVIIKASLEIFLAHLLRYQQESQATSVAKKQYQQEKLQEFLDMFEDNITTKKHAADYADRLNLSPFQLNSITKSLMGKTVAALIEDQILLEAKRLLLGTSNQVAQIASQLGYEDVSYFIRFFKKKMGATPEAFRRNSL